MQFRLELTVQEIAIPADSPIQIAIGKHNDFKFEMRSPTVEEQNQGYSTGNAHLTLFGEFDLPSELQHYFDSLEQNRLPGGVRNDEEHPFADPDGTLTNQPPLSSFPHEFQDYVNGVSSELFRVARTTLGLIRWHKNVRGPWSPISIRGKYWSMDGENWKGVPSDLSFFGEAIGTTLRVSERTKDYIRTELSEDRQEPIAREIFREAWAQRTKNPRSSILLGVAAAEIGFKALVANLIPDAEWLVQEMPSPPLDKMLKEYLPKLPVRMGSAKAPPKSIRREIKWAIETRNGLIHSGEKAPSVEEAHTTLLAVDDLLWAFDFFVGNEWASEYIRDDVRRDWAFE